MLSYEKKYNFKLIAGVDEAGRGPLAGPVAAAAVIMPCDNFIDGIDDSKKLSEKMREKLFGLIIEKAVDYKVVMVDNYMIDQINILQATKSAMIQAVNGLKIAPEIVLVDAVSLELIYPTEAIIKGDSLSYNIAAASILAKVTRDRYMAETAKSYPEYLFERHKGYGTELHIEMLKKYGPCPLHRKSFIKNII